MSYSYIVFFYFSLVDSFCFSFYSSVSFSVCLFVASTKTNKKKMIVL